MSTSATRDPDSTDVGAIATELWSTLAKLREGTSLSWADYSVPMLGILFLRAVSDQFDRVAKELGPGSERNPREPADFHARNVLYVSATTHFDAIAKAPEGLDLGKLLSDSMRELEAANSDLRGSLPKTYSVVPGATLHEGIRLVSHLKLSVEDYGTIFAELLLRIAQEEGQDGGDLFVTAPHIVDLMVAIVQPDKGRVFDPCSGSGGMFTGCLRHAREQHGPEGFGFYGQEKSSRNAALSVMNLAVHGATGLIEVGDSYIQDRHEALQKFDFALANPKFNDTAFDPKVVSDDERFPSGAPTKKANYLWLQLCHSALALSGRAAIVMPNSASDGTKGETAIRKRWIEQDDVEAIVAVGEKMFGSITNPATIWFFNRAKATSQEDRVLFIDARETYAPVDGAQRHWTSAQVTDLARLVLSWRSGEGGTPEVQGLCRVAHRDEIADHDWSLSPGRYVRYQVPDDSYDASQIRCLAGEFRELDEEASGLSRRVLTVIEEIYDA